MLKMIKIDLDFFPTKRGKTNTDLQPKIGGMFVFQSLTFKLNGTIDFFDS